MDPLSNLVCRPGSDALPGHFLMTFPLDTTEILGQRYMLLRLCLWQVVLLSQPRGWRLGKEAIYARPNLRIGPLAATQRTTQEISCQLRRSRRPSLAPNAPFAWTATNKLPRKSSGQTNRINRYPFYHLETLLALQLNRFASLHPKGHVYKQHRNLWARTTNLAKPAMLASLSNTTIDRCPH